MGRLPRFGWVAWAPSLPKVLKPEPHAANLGPGTWSYSRPCCSPQFQVLLFFFPQDENKDFVPSSRRKQFGSSEYLSQVDTPGKRPATKLELQDADSNPYPPLSLQSEEQVCKFKDHV